MWIDDEGSRIGDVGFLVATQRDGGAEIVTLRDRPAHTNGSREPRLGGWCGTTDNVAVYARGMGRVTRVARGRHGELLGRACVERLRGSALAAALEAAGYPDLGVA